MKRNLLIVTMMLMLFIINAFGAYNQSLPVTTFEELEGKTYEIKEITDDYWIIEVDGEYYYVPKAY